MVADVSRRFFMSMLASLGFISTAEAGFNKQTCGNCRFWLDPALHKDLEETMIDEANLERRRPELEPYGECHVRSVQKFPVRFNLNWCGEWKPDTK